MSKRKPDELLDHDYDGIHEFDNPLPNWWLATFYGAVIFSFIYVGYYHFGPGPSPEQELARDLARLEEQAAKGRAEEPAPTEEKLAAVLNDPAQRAMGAKVFAEKCAACHGTKGEGQIGPNLTDSFWIHDNGALVSLFTVISKGVAEKGMPPWGAMLRPEELAAVVAHTKSLQGTKPANPKAPQGLEAK